MPAAHLVWPIIDFTEPITQDRDTAPDSRMIRPSDGNLGLIADHRAGAVGLDELDAGRRDVGLGVGTLQGAELSFGPRGGQSLVAAVAGSADALDDRVNAIAVALGIGQALEDDGDHALADDDAVGGLVEGAAPAARRKGVRLAEGHVGVRILHRVRAHDHGQVARAHLQLADAGVQSGQRRAAGGVDGVVRPAEVEAIGDAAGDDVDQDAGERILGPLRQQRLGLAQNFGGAVLQPRHRGQHRQIRAEAVRDGELGCRRRRRRG